MPEDFRSSSDKECRIGGYVLLRTIGKGSFAKVMLARHIVTGAEVAVKITNRQGSTLAYRECQCLKKLNHPNITKLFEVIATQDQFYFFMEHLSGGELYDYLEKNGAQTEEEARTLFRQLLSALHYCHQKGVVHRDLKPENILLDADHNIKLADFGLSKEFSNNKLSSFCGTVTHTAPEILRNQPYDGPKADIWSLGVILYKILTGRLPFDGHNFGEVKKRVVRGHFLLPNSISEECQNLLRRIMTLDPTERPTLEDIMKDPWVNKGCKEGVQLYCEPPSGDIDHQITEKMKYLGYDQEEIRESVAQKTFNNIMGTYLILHSANMKIGGHTVRVRPCSFPGQRQHHSKTPELRAVGEKRNRPASPPTNVAVKVAIPATSVAPRVTVPSTSGSVRVAVPATSVAPRVTVPSTSGSVRVAVPATSVAPKVTVPSTSGSVRVAVPATSVAPRVTVPSTSGSVRVAVPATSVAPKVTVPTTRILVKVAVPGTSVATQVTMSSTSVAHWVAIPSTGVEVKLAVPSASSQVEEAIESISVNTEVAVPSATSEPEMVIESTSVCTELAIPSATSEPEVVIQCTSVHMEVAVPSSTSEPEVVIQCTSVHTELAVPSASTEPRVDVSTTRGGGKVFIKAESVKSRTLSCPESRAATPRPAFHQSSLGSLTTATSALKNGSSGSLTTPGSRESSTRSTRNTRSTNSSQSSSSHHGEGRQQGPRRVLHFFLKLFCCRPSPSMDKHHQNKQRAQTKLSAKPWRAKIGPQ